MKRFWVQGVGLATVLWLAGGCASLHGGALPQGSASHEWRAAWLASFQDNVRDAASARLLVRQVQSQRLNTLFVPAILDGMAFYPSQVAPVFVPPGSYRPLEIDLVQTMLDAAREEGRPKVQIYAWVSFAHVWQSRDLIPPSHPVVQHPDWVTANYDINRPPDTIPDFWLDPGVPAVEQYAGEICRELAYRYPQLDGIVLDSIQYRSSDSGYNAAALQRFDKDTGRSGRPAPNDAVWQAWKARRVTQLLERMVLAVRGQRMDIPIAVVGLAEGPVTARFNETQGYIEGGQDWPGWLGQDLADVLVLRDFKRKANATEDKLFRDWIGYAKIRSSGKAVVCGITARDNALFATQSLIAEAREEGIQGVALWTYRDNNTEGRPPTVLYEHLDNTVFRSRAKPPILPWLHPVTTGIIAGQVRTAAFLPLPNVRVYFPGLDREVYTHYDGLYVAFDVPAKTTVRTEAYYLGKLYQADQTVTASPASIQIADIPVVP